MIITTFPDLVKFKDKTKCSACKDEASSMLVRLAMSGIKVLRINFDTTCYHNESERRGINEGSNE